MKSERELKAEWLSRSEPLRLRLIGLRAERMERLSRADYGGIRYGDRTGGRSGNGIEQKYAALAETDAEITELQRELDRIEAEIRAAIDEIKNPLYQTYLRMRFLAYKTERQIAFETNYSPGYIGSVVRKKSIDSVKIPANTR